MTPDTHERFRFVVSNHIWEARFRWKRLRVCLLCLWHLRHWPMNDLTDTEWRFQLDGATAWEAFLEGWCRE